MFFGVSTASFYPMHTEKALLFLAENGIKNIEIFLNSNLEIKGEVFKNMLCTVKEYGLNILSFHPLPVLDNLYLFSGYDRRKQEYFNVYRVYFEKMNMLGAKILVLHGAGNSIFCPNERYFERFAELYDLGQEYGITVAQENVHYCKSGSLEFLKEMSNALGEKANFVLDLKQAVRASYTGFDVFELIGEKIIHIHASDSGGKGDCLPVNAGDFDFNRFLSLLKKSGYEKGFLIELYSEDYDDYNELIESVKALEEIYAKI